MSNIKELIRQEIERLYDGEAPKHDQQCEFEDGYFTGIATISRFIDSLPEETCKENTDSFTEDLEEAAYEYSFESRPSIYGQVDVIDAFKAGAEWQKAKMFKDAVDC